MSYNAGPNEELTLDERSADTSHVTGTPTFTVSEINSHVKHILDADGQLHDLWVSGEISNWRSYQSGHAYFTLKDEGSELSCVMWRDRANELPFHPENGNRVRVHGNISVYEKRGAYQLYATEMESDGVGTLWEAFERLKAQLANEGLFDDKLKRSLPAFAQRIGMVTSPDGAALRDIIHVAQTRCPSVDLTLIPTLVQGTGAAEDIARAIRLADTVGKFDALIVGRGGGSLEDLWAFNEEIVARAAANAKTPIVSAVGHETDFTILDFVADVRAATPSAAAELTVPDAREKYRHISSILGAGIRAIGGQLNILRERINALRSRRVLTHPHELLNVRHQLTDDLTEQLTNTMERKLLEAHRRFETASGQLGALSPLAVLDRGYALVRSHDTQRLIPRVAKFQATGKVDVVMSDGILEVDVKKVVRNDGH